MQPHFSRRPSRATIVVCGHASLAWTMHVLERRLLIPKFATAQIWNNLCTRTTTKREDIVSILAIMLEFRPSEILSLPTEQRVGSIFHALTALPLSFLYRERPMIINWRDARCWLPPTIEEIPIDSGGGIMWRR